MTTLIFRLVAFLAICAVLSCSTKNKSSTDNSNQQSSETIVIRDSDLTNRLSQAFDSSDYDTVVELLPEWCLLQSGEIQEFWCPYYEARLCWAQENYSCSIELLETVKNVLTAGNQASSVSIGDVELMIAHCHLRKGNSEFACRIFATLDESVKTDGTVFSNELGSICSHE